MGHMAGPFYSLEWETASPFNARLFAGLPSRSSKSEGWWGGRGSNPQPSVSKTDQVLLSINGLQRTLDQTLTKPAETCRAKAN